MKRSTIALSLVLAGMIVFAFASPAFAQGGTPPSDQAGKSIVDVIYSIAEMFIKVLIGGSVAIFAASIARGSFSAQLANLVGSPMGMSQAWLNIVAAIFTFVIAILSPLVVNVIFDVIKAYASTTVNIPSLGG